MDAIQSLEQFPTRYHVFARVRNLPQSSVEVREMLFGKRRGTHQVFYRIVDDRVEVLHIRRATRGPVNASDLT
jgi:hypothetical protein